MESGIKPIVEVENLVVKADFRRPFRGKTWVTVFYEEGLKTLRTPARAVLLTLLVESYPKGGILRVHRSSLRGVYKGRNKVNEALRELRDAGLVWRGGDFISISPHLAYSGPAADYRRSLEAWEELLKTTQEEGE
jgi:hypothetical protein